MSRAPGSGSVRVLASPSAAGADGNPYIDLLYSGVRDTGLEVREFDRRSLLAGKQIVHVHWPASLIRWDSGPRACLDVAKVLAGLFIARRRGSKLVWTGHDLEPHELRMPRLYRLYFAAFCRLIDVWISLTPAGAALLRARYPVLRKRPARVIPHGSYRSSYPARPNRREAERALALTGGAGGSFLLLGQVRRYKNALPLLAAFAVGDHGDERLIIAGEVRGDARLAAELRAAAADRPDITVRLSRVPASEVSAWHAAADAVILPYDTKSALNSGALMLALSLDTPVVIADSPINRELRDTVGAAWVHLFDGDAASALAVAAQVSREPRSGRPNLDAFAWPSIVQATVQVYRDLAEPHA